MGRTNAASGENIIIARAQGIDGGNDFPADIGNDAGLADLDALGFKKPRDIVQIFIFSAAIL